MRYFAVRLVVSLLTFAIGLASAALLQTSGPATISNGGGEVQEIMRVESAYIRAHLTRDVATLDDILADECTIEGLGGRVTTKAQRLEKLESPDFAFESFSTSDVSVDVTGDVAIVRGQAITETREGDRLYAGVPYSFARNYEKRNGRWQIVSVRTRRCK